MEKKISVKDLLMQAFLTGWELSDKSISQDEYLQSAIQVIEVLQVEPENIYAEEGLGLTDGDEVDIWTTCSAPTASGSITAWRRRISSSSSGIRMRPPPRPSWRSSKSWATASSTSWT